MNNIHVSDSQIGVLNTGNISNMDGIVTVLKNDGNTELAMTLATLTQAVIESNELAREQKDEIIELLGVLSSEAVAPKQNRKMAVVRTIFSKLTTLLTNAATLGEA